MSIFYNLFDISYILMILVFHVFNNNSVSLEYFLNSAPRQFKNTSYYWTLSRSWFDWIYGSRPRTWESMWKLAGGS